MSDQTLLDKVVAELHAARLHRLDDDGVLVSCGVFVECIGMSPLDVSLAQHALAVVTMAIVEYRADLEALHSLDQECPRLDEIDTLLEIVFGADLPDVDDVELTIVGDVL